MILKIQMIRILLFSLFIGQTPHVSFLGVECFPEKEIIRAYLKLKYTDFIFDYRLTINDDQHFDQSGTIDTTEILLKKYVNDRIVISADDKKLSGQLARFGTSGGELTIELIYPLPAKAKRYKVTNTILTAVNINQSNLVIFKNNDYEEEVKLSSAKTTHTFMIDRGR